MTNDLTIATLSFVLRASDLKDGSERRETVRGVNLPTIMTIKHQDYIDSKTKRPGVRSVLRFDRHVSMADGSIEPVSMYLVAAIPTDANVTSTDITALNECIVGTIQEDDSGLDKALAIFGSKEQ